MSSDVRKIMFLKRFSRKVSVLVMIIPMIFVTMTIPGAVSAVESSGQQITAGDYLKSDGGYLKNQSGRTVVLRGVNAGGWLIQETWMCPVNGEDRKWANLNTLDTLKSRGFTDKQIQTLFTTYQDNWLSTTDLDNLKAMNVNCIRVPFWYRNFMLDEAGTWITGTDLASNPGIQKLDWVISECGKRGIYVILDCHGAPGGQSMDHSSGTMARNDLYDSPALRKVFKDMWMKIAARYKNSPAVAAYDIMNEPQNNSGYEGEHSYTPETKEALDRTWSVYDEIYKAIRGVDPKHIISMEGIWSGRCLPNPAKYGWTNLLYQMHLYNNTKASIDSGINQLKSLRSYYGVAVYSGEFNSDPEEEYAMSEYNKAGISWTTWAYKGSKQDVGNKWFLYVKNLPFADVTVDSYDTILSKWGSVLNTSNFDTNTATVKKWITDRINDPIPAIIEAPAFSPAAGIINGIQNVTISCKTPGTTIRYTTDGSTPTERSDIYRTPICVSTEQTIKAIAMKTGLNNSIVASSAYTISSIVATPKFSLAGGTYKGTKKVTIECATIGAIIRYTTNGTTPTAKSPKYSAPISVTTTKTIKAIAIKPQMNNSSVASATYTIKP